ncbi:Uncharacterised protein [Mycobacteroides abscessus subsp. abscessus]|nr:Uncharacterised protein [Mycobacteroides abscessus subsp. abscessus]
MYLKSVCVNNTDTFVPAASAYELPAPLVVWRATPAPDTGLVMNGENAP